MTELKITKTTLEEAQQDIMTKLTHYAILYFEEKFTTLLKIIEEKEKLYKQEEQNVLSLLIELAVIPGCENLAVLGYYSEKLDDALDWIRQKAQEEKSNG